MSLSQQDRAAALRTEERERAWRERRLARDRSKLIGMIAIVLLILLLTFLRFGKTIPWGAR